MNYACLTIIHLHAVGAWPLFLIIKGSQAKFKAKWFERPIIKSDQHKKFHEYNASWYVFDFLYDFKGHDHGMRIYNGEHKKKRKYETWCTKVKNKEKQSLYKP